MRSHHRRSIAAAAATAATVIAFTVAQAAPAHAASPISNVQIGWADSAHTQIHVTSTNTAGTPAYVGVLGQRLGDKLSIGSSAYSSGTTGASLDTSLFPHGGTWNIVVSDHAPVSGEAYDAATMAKSVPFDADRPPAPTVTALAPTSEGGQVIDVQPGTPITDGTPGDPLDEDVPVQYSATEVGGYAKADPDTVVDWSPRTHLTLSGKDSYGNYYSLPAKIRLYARGVWGSSPEMPVWLNLMDFYPRPTSQITTYGNSFTITGFPTETYYWCSGFSGICDNDGEYAGPATVVLQARDTATSPWYTVGSQQVPTGADVTLRPTGYWTREFRIIIPTHVRLGVSNSPHAPAVVYSSTSVPFTGTVKAKTYSAKFLDNTATYGQKVTAYIKVAPTTIAKATLQRWNGTSWTSVKYVYLTNGQGSYTFTSTTRGTTTWRFWIDGVTSGTHTVAANPSPTFTLYTN